jgi:hypothetical protein
MPPLARRNNESAVYHHSAAHPSAAALPICTASPALAWDRTEAAIVRHLTQKELARRWCLSPRTLERWRWLGQGPAFLKLGGRVAYRLEDIEAFEAAQTRDVSGGTGEHRPLA